MGEGDLTLMSTTNQPSRKQREEFAKTGDNPIISVELGSKYLAKRRRDRYRLLGEKNRDKNKLEHAKRCLEKALYISMNLEDSDQVATAMDLESLGTILYLQGKHEAAEALMSRARRIKESY